MIEAHEWESTLTKYLLDGLGTFLGISSLESRIITPEQWFSSLRMCQNHLVGFLTKLLGPTPRVLDSVGLGLGWRICAFNKFPVGGDAVGQRTAFTTIEVCELLLG